MSRTHMQAVLIIAIGILMPGTLFAAGITSADRAFIEAAAYASHTQIDGARLAQKRAASSDVKSFAATMLEDHIRLGEELEKLAALKNVKIPTEPRLSQKARLRLLGTYSGASFDKRYVREICMDEHAQAVKLFRKAARDADDREIRDLAGKLLPRLEHHLQMANTLSSDVARER
ncbi:DUF4142 domain-containing protein [Uliginosibacterium sp. H3]|uniref:DUF4142 domain-containing protein n=1 Tax=Uliginosibacterium silvisoli TaxID=3114758 RepID=A0ABU6K874_9RHOO|nr:DUF4142 domain-containing protein [Uliginosibacterium sp. H3]